MHLLKSARSAYCFSSALELSERKRKQKYLPLPHAGGGRGWVFVFEAAYLSNGSGLLNFGLFE